MSRRWLRLDNAAKTFPPSASKDDPRIFRISIELKEKINLKYLNQALDTTLLDFPLFLSELKKGVFWYYLDPSDIKPVITMDDNSPTASLKQKLLFQITYYNKRINIEVNHALTDGVGTLEFTKCLISNYLSLKHNIKIKEELTTSSIEEKESDGFIKHYEKRKLIVKKRKPAYQFRGKKYLEGKLKIIEGIIPLGEIIKLAKEKNTTLTIYLTAILFKSIADNMNNRDKKKTISIDIPVNLRPYFESNTIRNFFNTISVTYNFSESSDDLDSIIESITNEFKEKINKEYLAGSMNNYLYLEQHLLLRLIPLPIKNFGIKYVLKYLRKTQTMVFSNVGIITMPEEIKNYIDYFAVFISTNKMQMCMGSYNNKLVINFASRFKSSEIEKTFFRYLTSTINGIVINTNHLEDENV